MGDQFSIMIMRNNAVKILKLLFLNLVIMKKLLSNISILTPSGIPGVFVVSEDEAKGVKPGKSKLSNFEFYYIFKKLEICLMIIIKI